MGPEKIKTGNYLFVLILAFRFPLNFLNPVISSTYSSKQKPKGLKECKPTKRNAVTPKYFVKVGAFAKKSQKENSGSSTFLNFSKCATKELCGFRDVNDKITELSDLEGLWEWNCLNFETIPSVSGYTFKKCLLFFLKFVIIDAKKD